MTVSRASLRFIATLGLVSAVTLLAGVIAVSLIPDQLNPGVAERALAEIGAHHQAEVIAGWMFAIGLATIIPFIWQVVRTIDEPGRMFAAIGACIITVGATIDVGASMLMVALGHGIAPWSADPMNRAIGSALLHLGASLDAMYNLTLGVGLVMIGRSMRQSGWPRWLAKLAVAAGILSLPVSLEWYSPAAAAVQYASGTLVLVWVVGASVVAGVRGGKREEGRGKREEERREWGIGNRE
jgi:hypothetical protein